MAHEILDSTWRTGTLGCVGFVAVGRVDGWKAYTGPVEGFNERSDEQEIAAHGAPLMEAEARAIFPQLESRIYAR